MNRCFSAPIRTAFTIPAMIALLFSAGCTSMSARSAEAAETSASEQAYQAGYFAVSLALENRDYDWAIERVEPWRGEKDCPPELLVALAEGYMGARDWDEALKVLTETIDRHPDFIPARKLRADINRRRGKREEAIADIEAALERAPRNESMLESLGLLRLRSITNWGPGLKDNEDVDKMIDVYQRLLGVKKGARKITPLVILSSIHSRIDRHERAIEYGRQAVRLVPQDLRAQLALAEAYETANQPSDALDAYRQALLVESDNPVIQAKIAELIRTEDVEGGLLGFYEKLATDFPGVGEIQELYGSALLEDEEWAKAVTHYQEQMLQRPEDLRVMLGYVRALLLAGNEDRAMTVVEHLVAEGPTPIEGLLELAEFLRSEGMADTALRLLAKAQDAGEKDHRLLLALSRVQAESGDSDQAMETLEALIASRPDIFPAVAMLADLYAEQDRFEDALALFAGLDEVTREQRSVEIKIREAELYRQQQMWPEAVAALDEVVADNAAAAEFAIRMLIEIHLEAGTVDAAHAALDRYIAASRGEAERNGRSLKAWLHWRTRDYGQAIGMLESLHEEDPEDFATVQLLAENYAEVGDFSKAEGLLQAERILQAGDASESHLLLTARIYHLQDKDDAAIEVIEKLLARDPDNGDYLMVAGEYYYGADRLDDAEKVLRRAISLDPGNAEAYNALGYFFAEAGIKIDQALELVQKALELKPGAGHIIDSLGWIYYVQGDYVRAVESLELAAEKMKDSPDAVVYEHLGDAYAKMGGPEEARKAWQRSLELNPDSLSVQEKLQASE